jgi:nicotinate-nucleotide adenylyltransferase
VKALILGGTFNPVHFGHLFLAEEARSRFGYDSVILAPAFHPVHKDAAPILAPSHRLEMLQRAVRGQARFVVDACEIERGGPSYSIETVRELVPRHRIEGKPGFLIGDDLAAGFHTWKEAEALSREVDLILARRAPGATVDFPYPHRALDNFLLPLSSSDIRRRAAAGLTIRFLLPDEVADYIEANALYG